MVFCAFRRLQELLPKQIQTRDNSNTCANFFVLIKEDCEPLSQTSIITYQVFIDSDLENNG